MARVTIGWDIGGAHLKVVVCNEQGDICFVEQIETPLWKGLDVLVHAVKKIPVDLIDKAAIHALTMTGELADIFPDRSTGVNQLVQRFSELLGAERIRVYAGREGWLTTEQVRGKEEAIASANWYATSEFTSINKNKGLIIDVGSTTTDIIPVTDGVIDSIGYTDHERLQSDELVYSGVIRTPVASIVSKVPFVGEWQQIATEYFSTMGDIYQLTGALPESTEFATADGQGTEKHACARRLARVLGCDYAVFPMAAWLQLAEYIADQHRLKISQAIARVMSRYPDCAGGPGEQRALIAAGVGRFLIKRIANEHEYPYYCFSEFVSVVEQKNNPRSEQLKQASALCAPATACAILCRSEWMNQTNNYR